MKRWLNSLFFPLLFVVLLWIIKVVEKEIVEKSFGAFGILPLHAEGLLGIFTSPFIHSSYEHLISNTIPLLILGTALFYFYKKLAINVCVISWLLTGVLVWTGGREAYHIGASGLIYSFVAFLFFSGILRKYPRLIALSLLVTFIYGGTIWGIFPREEGVSWESHLFGFIIGMVLAVFYRKQGPQRKKFDWEDEKDFDVKETPIDNESSYSEITYNDDYIDIRYFYIEKKPDKRKKRQENI